MSMQKLSLKCLHHLLSDEPAPAAPMPPKGRYPSEFYETAVYQALMGQGVAPGGRGRGRGRGKGRGRGQSAAKKRPAAAEQGHAGRAAASELEPSANQCSRYSSKASFMSRWNHQEKSDALKEVNQLLLQRRRRWPCQPKQLQCGVLTKPTRLAWWGDEAKLVS